LPNAWFRCVNDGKPSSKLPRPQSSSCCFETLSLKSRMWAHKSGPVRGLGSDRPSLLDNASTRARRRGTTRQRSVK
jgi:hypothetical protein